MSRTEEVLAQLSRLDPFRDEEPASPAFSPRRRTARVRLAIGAGFATAIAVALLAAVALNPNDGSEGVVAAAAAPAADQPPIKIADDQYAFRKEEWFQASIPGDIADASPDGLSVSGADADPAPREGQREIWFSPRNRGQVEGDKGEDWARCSAADWIINYATSETCWADIGGPDGMNYLFEAPPAFQQAVLENVGPKHQPAQYWEFSPEIADLGTDPVQIDAAVDDLSDRLQEKQGVFIALGNNSDRMFWRPQEAEDAGDRLRAVAGLLANPLAPPGVRAALFEYAGSIDGVETSDDATDPEGREGASISVTSTPADPLPAIVSGLPATIEDPLNQYASDGYRLDLSGVTFRTEVIFDPDTSELLAVRTELVAADDPLLGPWLQRKGAPQTIHERTFEPIVVVDSTDDNGAQR